MSTFADPEHELSPQRVAELLADGSAEVIDVREPYEREAGRIPGTRHIELERLASEAQAVPRETPVVFYCRVGARSGMAAQAFRTAGYEAFNLTGGITAWRDAGLPLEPEDGHVAEH
jgi:rhodanese-related sulfurtransferase